MNYKTYIEVFSALLTPLIAILAVYIAYQQHKTNKTKLRHDLYEKQLDFYRSVMEFIVFAKRSPITDDGMARMNPVSMEAEFFFGKDVSAHLDNIRMKAITTRARERDKITASGVERERLSQEIEEIEKWFSGQIVPTHEKLRNT